jgi:phospholipid transport system substrate-binding protein
MRVCQLQELVVSVHNRLPLIAFIALAFLALVGSAVPARAAECPAAGAVKSAAQSFIGAARSGSPAAFSAALARHADINALAMFALGKYRKDLPASRKAEYVKKAHAYMGRFLAKHAGRFDGSGFTIDSCKGNLVRTSLNGRSEMTWRMSGRRIQDVRVQGFWLTLQMRSKFTDVIRRGDNRVERLIDFLGRA